MYIVIEINRNTAQRVPEKMAQVYAPQFYNDTLDMRFSTKCSQRTCIHNKGHTRFPVSCFRFREPYFCFKFSLILFHRIYYVCFMVC